MSLPTASPVSVRNRWNRVIAASRRDLPLMLLDVAILFAAYLAPLALRFEGKVPPAFWHNFWVFVPVAGLLHLLSNYLFGLYGQMWRYASVQEARRVILAGLMAAMPVVGLAMLTRPRPLPLSVVIMGSGFALVGFGALRFQSRLFSLRRRAATAAPERVLVVGAGDAGAMIVKDLIEQPSLGRNPVGLVDDDPRKRGASLHGVAVLGGRAAIPVLVERRRVDEVLLAIPSATGELVREVAAVCEQAGVPLRVLPSAREIVDGRVTIKDMRELRIEDLLGRQQAQMDRAAVAAMIRGRRVLVTGAGGSIGSEIARQVASLGPSHLLLLDHDETHLHDVSAELGPPVEVELVLADVRDRERILAVFARHRPWVVFHAAAHKHVTFLEASPEEALATNVLGTANVADASVATGVEHFVMISTDKAVHPASVMGASKLFAERIVRTLNGAGCAFSSVRFGNVLGSRGSVIPTFLRQIAAGGPVTVTDPAMTRYFMSVGEAVELVLQAAALSSGGEVFTLDMGEPVNILELARRVIRLSGRVPERDVRIQIVGARPGEKLVEEVVDPDEHPQLTAHPSIWVSRPPVPDPATLRDSIRQMEHLAAEGRTEELATGMKALAEHRTVSLVAGGVA